MDDNALIRHLLASIRADVDAIEMCLRGSDAPAPDPKQCPRCWETERTEDTSTAKQPRLTCLTCGTSWTPGTEFPSLKENHGEPGRPQ